VAGKSKFTRIPKVNDLVLAGVPTEAIPTYCCIADYANNKTGLCWPKMETLARTLNRSVRTVQRHLHLLRELGLIEFVNRRRHKGKFSSYLYKIVFIATTGHGWRLVKGDPNIRRTKRTTNAPKSPQKDRAEGYWWSFGEQAPAGKQEEHDRRQFEKRKEAAKRRTDGFEWLFE
jgi:DNA-binding transcriptional ArsR family regulator